MATVPDAAQFVEILRGTILGVVRNKATDLTARQLAVFLTCYLDNEPQTVRGLAAKLDVAKPAITRAIDRLEDVGLARRKADPQDRRSVLVAHTAKGNAFLLELKRLMQRAANEAVDAVGQNGSGLATS